MSQVSVRQGNMLMSHHRTSSMESSPQSSFVITNVPTTTPNETYHQSPSSADPECTSTTTSTSSHHSKDKVASQPEQQLAKPVNFPSPSRSPETAVAACAEGNIEQLSGGTAATADTALVKKLQCKGASENGDAIQEGEAASNAAADAAVSDEEVTSSTKKRARVETIVTNIIARDKLISQGVGGDKNFLSAAVPERCDMEKAKRSNPAKGMNKRKSGISAEEIVNLSAEQSATNELNEKFALNVLKGFSSNLATAGALNLVLAGQKHADSSSVSSAMYNYFANNNNNNDEEGEDEDDEDTADGEMDDENGGWSSPTPKKARYDSNYRAAVRVTAISDNPSDEVECGNMMDYTILVDTLKRELMGAFEKVAEQSARRVLDRLVARKRTSQDGGKTSNVKQRRDKSGSNSYNNEDAGQHCKRQPDGGKKQQDVSESKYRHRQNHRRLNRNPELLSAKKRSNSEDENKIHSANDDDDDNDNDDDANSSKSSKTSTRSLDAEEQTDALSLVIKARSKSSGSSSPQQYKCHGRSVSPYESLSNNGERRKTSSGSTSNIKQNLDYEYSLVRAARGEKSSPVVAPNSASESDSGVEKNDEDRRSSAFWTPVKNDRLCNDGGTSPTAPSLQASFGLHATSPIGASCSSAFAQRSFFQHLHHHPWQSNSLATALARQHQQQQQQYRNDSLVGDAPSLLWQARQTSDFKLNNSTLTSAAAVGSLKHSPSMQSQVPPFLGRSPIVPPFYLPLPVSATSQSPPIFSPSHLTFPLLQNFPQGAFVNALANSECRRIRTACDQSVGRSVAARTTTREPGKHRGDYSSATDDVSPYSAASIQEGLTPQHLKKAKLMFFYTRYPSANTLKTYFGDVKFTRATTSQLIKWFSNFREFYYIQMEKFARQALTEGISEASQLQVSRNGELFRALNLHYNKSNEFRVPERFLDVTHTSLREFFMAIKTGKDHEPSWKKVIYKVICKLDQDIPELFKSSNVLDRLDEIID